DYVKDIVLLGGGILSLEIADRLKDLNKNITIIEAGPRLMPKQLDQDASSIFNKILENSKINIFLSEGIDEIYGTGNNYGEVCGIKLSHSARKINCQMIIQSLGNISDLTLFENTGLNLNRGIMVDEFMRSSDENIYAIGDIAEFEGKMIGLWPRAIEMAKVAGANIVGDNSRKFKDTPIGSSFNGFETKIFSIGEIGNSTENSYSILELKDPKLNIYKKFYFKDNLFVGGILMGDISKSIQLRKAINAASTIQHFLDMHFLDEI
ncbi:hypothetical protein EOM09_05510, partial [bacterium]|nr:hypothetical protein [bacterium]